MNLSGRINAFVALGQQLQQLSPSQVDEIITKVAYYNHWFTPESIRQAISGVVQLLDEADLLSWMSQYEIGMEYTQKKVGLIMAGNIPAVGFHDMMCILLSGHRMRAKVSQDDKILPVLLTDMLVSIEPAFASQIFFHDQMKEIDALIATGTDNTARYFDYYFSKIPRIIRKNRTSIAILNGSETKEDLLKLGKDIFTYFGLGCRNVSKIMVPRGYQFDTLFEALLPYGYVIHNDKYAHNYEYHRAIYLMNLDKFLDNNFLMIKESEALTSPVSVLFYQSYQDLDEVLDYINLYADQIQCIVSKDPKGKEVKFGQTQMPRIYDYADNVDTMRFLTSV